MSAEARQKKSFAKSGKGKLEMKVRKRRQTRWFWVTAFTCSPDLCKVLLTTKAPAGLKSRCCRLKNSPALGLNCSVLFNSSVWKLPNNISCAAMQEKTMWSKRITGTGVHLWVWCSILVQCLPGTDLYGQTHGFCNWIREFDSRWSYLRWRWKTLEINHLVWGSCSDPLPCAAKNHRFPPTSSSQDCCHGQLPRPWLCRAPSPPGPLPPCSSCSSSHESPDTTVSSTPVQNWAVVSCAVGQPAVSAARPHPLPTALSSLGFLKKEN